MQNLNTILVGLDFSEADETIIDYVVRMSQKTSLQKLYFINVQQSLDLPKEITEKYPDMVAPKDEQLKKMITERVNHSSEGTLDCEYEIHIAEGNTTDQLLKWAKIKGVDLLVVGKKLDFSKQEISAGKLARLAPCSVFFIPEVMPEYLTELVVPTDFSDHAKSALEHALFLKSIFKELNISCVHFYNVPQGYHLSGKNYDDFADLMKENAIKQYDKFIADIDLNGAEIDSEFIFDKTDNPAEQIYKYAIKRQASGIVIGSKGRTMAASVILGSVAEKLLSINTHFPLFISKKKNHNLNFLEALIG